MKFFYFQLFNFIAAIRINFLLMTRSAISLVHKKKMLTFSTFDKKLYLIALRMKMKFFIIISSIFFLFEGFMCSTLRERMRKKLDAAKHALMKPHRLRCSPKSHLFLLIYSVTPMHYL